MSFTAGRDSVGTVVPPPAYETTVGSPMATFASAGFTAGGTAAATSAAGFVISTGFVGAALASADWTGGGAGDGVSGAFANGGGVRTCGIAAAGGAAGAGNGFTGP